MGGRGSSSKILSNIDAKRYAQVRADRGREIEAERTMRRQNPTPDFAKLTEKQLADMSPRQRGYMRVEIAVANKDIKQLHRARADVSEFVNAHQKVGNSFKRPDSEAKAERNRAVSDLNAEINRAYRKLGHPEFTND